MYPVINTANRRRLLLMLGAAHMPTKMPVWMGCRTTR
jgi:hypothetical protein